MAQTNVRRVNIGGNLKLTVGNFTSSEGAAAETIAVEGGQVIAVLFSSQDTSGALQTILPRWSVSTSGGISTVTVYTQEGVTTGSFTILHA